MRLCWLWLIAAGAFAFESLNLATTFDFLLSKSLDFLGKINQVICLQRAQALQVLQILQ